MEAQMLTPQPVSNKQGIGGWLIFIGLRLVVGLIMNIVGIAGMAVNKASGMYYLSLIHISPEVRSGSLPFSSLTPS